MNHPPRPDTLSPNYIPRITGATGKHAGYFQLLEFHLKKHNIYSCHISDGFFLLKVIFLDVAGTLLGETKIKLLSVVYGDVYNYSFEDGVYLVKDVVGMWDYEEVVGEPRDWRPRRVNDNSRGRNQLHWGDVREPMGYAFSFKGEEEKEERKEEEVVMERTQSLVDKEDRVQNQKNSNVQLPQLNEEQAQLIPESEKKPSAMRPAQPSTQQQLLFSEEDFAQLQAILDDHQKGKQSGSKKKMRVSTTSENLNDLRESLDLFDVDRLDQECKQQNPPQENVEPVDQIPQIPILPSQVFHEQPHYPTSHQQNNNLGLEDISDLLQAIEDNNRSPTQILRQKTGSFHTQHISSRPSSQKDDFLNLPDFDLLENLESNKSAPAAVSSKRKQYKVEIAELSPELSGWYLHALVVAKGSICRRYFREKKVSNFVCVLKDSKGNAIEATFSDQSFHDRIEEGRFYEFMNGEVKASRNKVHNNSNNTIEFGRMAITHLSQGFNCQSNIIYTNIGQIHQLPVQTFVHTIAIIKKCDSIKYFKDGQNKTRTSCVLIDPISCSEIELMDFGGLNLSAFKPLQIVSVYNAKISKYRELKGLVAWSNTIVKDGNQHEQTVKTLEQFQNQELLEKIIMKFSFPKRTLGELKQLEHCLMQNQNQPIDLSSEITGSFISFFKKSIYYLSCPQCRKKLVIQPNNKYSCFRCKTFKEPVPRFFFGGQFASHDGSIFASIEEKLAQRIIGMSPTEMWMIERQGNRKKLQKIYTQIVALQGRPLRIQLTGWVGLTNNQKRASYTIRHLQILTNQQQSNTLLQSINSYLQFV